MTNSAVRYDKLGGRSYRNVRKRETAPLLSLRTSPQAGVAIRFPCHPERSEGSPRALCSGGCTPCRFCRSWTGLERLGPPTARLRKWRPACIIPPCGARKTVRAYAVPPVFRPPPFCRLRRHFPRRGNLPLRKLRLCCIRSRRRKAAILRCAQDDTHSLAVILRPEAEESPG